MLTVRSTINISSQTVPPIIPVVQGDTGRAILFTLADFTIPAGATATYYVQKPSGEAVYNNATIDGNNVLVNLTAQSIIEKGDNYGQVRIAVGEDIVTSFDFILLVKEFRGIEAVQSLTEMNIFDKAVEQAADAIDDVKTDALDDMDSAKTAALDDIGDAKDAALQEIEQSTGNFADDFSASATYAAGDYVMHSGQLYRFTANHAAGAWTGSDAEAVTVGEELTDLKAETTDLKNDISQLETAVVKQTTTKRIPRGGTAQGGTEMTDIGYVDVNGVRQSSNGYSNSGYVKIEAWVTIDLLMYGLSSFCAVAFYDDNKTFISGIVPSGSGWQRIRGVQTIPDNAKYYIVTLMNADSTGYAICTDAIRVSSEQVEKLKEYTDERFKSLVNPTKVMVSDISGEGVQNGYIDASGKFNASDSWVCTGYIRTDAIENIRIRFNIIATVPAVAFFDEYKVFSGTFTSQTAGIQNLEIVIPNGVHYMRFSMAKEDTSQFYSYDISQMKANALYINQINDPLFEKKISAVGDSITIGTYSVPGMTYINQIANAHNMIVDNQAIWGSVFPTGKTQNGQPQGSIYSQIGSVSAESDMLVISGGINDADYQDDESYWGEISGGYATDLDTSTFCGAFEATLKSALDKFKGKPILFVFEHRITQKYQSQYGQHFENVQYPLMCEMLKKWGIPYVDLFHDMPSIKLIPDYIDAFSFDDQGIHPNVIGYRKFYTPRVESALISISSV